VLEPIVTAVKYLASRNVDYIIHTGMPVVTSLFDLFQPSRRPSFSEVAP
jgi:hypothetical protein